MVGAMLLMNREQVLWRGRGLGESSLGFFSSFLSSSEFSLGFSSGSLDRKGRFIWWVLNYRKIHIILLKMYNQTLQAWFLTFTFLFLLILVFLFLLHWFVRAVRVGVWIWVRVTLWGAGFIIAVPAALPLSSWLNNQIEKQSGQFNFFLSLGKN